MIFSRPTAALPRQEAPRFVEGWPHSGYHSDEQGRSWSPRPIRTRAILAVKPMNEMPTRLSPKQKEILLRGLRFVRSAVALDQIDYTPAVDAERKRQYSEIAELETLIGGSREAELSAAH